MLEEEYIVLSLDFQSIDKDVFENGASFSQGMARTILDAHEFEAVPVPEETLIALENLNDSEQNKVKLDCLF